MRLSPVVVVAALALSACGGSPSASKHSPSPSALATTAATPSTSPGATPSGTAGGPPLVHCDAAVPAGDNLVIGAVSGDPTVVVRDIQDPANAKNVCRFDPAAMSPRFINATSVA
ncbi:MAG TPA: hypothetical protein VNG04_01415, partial [Candidatus Acidoferrum sp.]|nr:hypothetical protein [Candidatus Acidoferrum sp.]